jgi:hypothetical protein
MSLALILAQGRSRTSLVRLSDICSVIRTIGRTTNLDTGQVTKQIMTVYAGRCRLKQPQATINSAQIAGGPENIQRPMLYLPFGTPILQVNDQITITASSTDAQIVGRVYHLPGDRVGSQTTAARYQVVEVTG